MSKRDTERFRTEPLTLALSPFPVSDVEMTESGKQGARCLPASGLWPS
jgi:hypothetical protein